MKQKLKNDFTAEERNALIRYAIRIGTRATCATSCLLHPLKIKELHDALQEVKQNHLKTIKEYQCKAKEYDVKTAKLSEFAISYFGGVPSKKQFLQYCNNIIKQEKENIQIMQRSYQLNVNYAFTPQYLLHFHQSLNPRTTFGYSNVLHEECTFDLTDPIKHVFLKSSLAEAKSYPDDWSHDFGYVYFESITKLLYEDLTIYKDDACILETLSHEKMFTISLSEEDKKHFITFENKQKRNEGILQLQ